MPGSKKPRSNRPTTRSLLALAELYTYREPTRLQGITMLAQLSNELRSSAAPAIQAWRQALTWMSGSPQAEGRPCSNIWRNTRTTRKSSSCWLISRRRRPVPRSSRRPTRTCSTATRSRPNAQFLADLKANPNDPQALAGLGLRGLRQQRVSARRDDLFGRRRSNWRPTSRRISPPLMTAPQPGAACQLVAPYPRQELRRRAGDSAPLLAASARRRGGAR